MQSHESLLALAAAPRAGPLVGGRFPRLHPHAALRRAIINYSAQTPTDRIAKLQAQIASGEVKLKWDEQFGWLPALLDELKIPKSSQMLVFSQTSLQRRAINPAQPARDLLQRRCLYRLHPGCADDGNLRRRSEARRRLLLARSGARRKSRHSRAARIASSATSRAGRSACRGISCARCGPMAAARSSPARTPATVTHCTPLADRWGGWYVTGQHGAQTHLGNLVGASAFDRHSGEPGFRGNLADLTQAHRHEQVSPAAAATSSR